MKTAFLCWALALPPLAADEQARKLPLVTWNDYEQHPHDYYEGEPQDPASVLFRQIQAGTKQPDTTSGRNYFLWLLKELQVPVESQLLVVSKTGLQRKVVSPATPRAMFFSDQTAITWIQDGMIEVQSFDAGRGPVFYILEGTETRQQVGKVRFARRESCLNGCHAGSATNYLPGLLARSLHVDLEGKPTSVDKAGIVVNAISLHENMSHAMPLRERWGGWAVTGAPAGLEHLGNILVPRGSQPLPFPDLKPMQEVLPYGTNSHIVPLLLHDHQVGLMNELYEALYRWRTHDFYAEKVRLGFKDDRLAVLSSTQTHAVAEGLESLVAELLFKDEAALPGVPITPDAGFLRAFSSQARRDARGRSLRDFQLTTHLLKHRCSHLIHSPQLLAMPAPFLQQLYARLDAALCGRSSAGKHLPAEERQAIREILLSVQPGYAEATRAS